MGIDQLHTEMGLTIARIRRISEKRRAVSDTLRGIGSGHAKQKALFYAFSNTIDEDIEILELAEQALVSARSARRTAVELKSRGDDTNIKLCAALETAAVALSAIETWKTSGAVSPIARDYAGSQAAQAYAVLREVTQGALDDLYSALNHGE